MSKAIPYDRTGRTTQKARTRTAIVDAAMGLIERGEDATVDAAAAAAGVGRGTAYRYFPNQQALLTAAHPWATADSLLPADPPDDPRERLRLVVGEITAMVRATEPTLRTMLRLSLEPGRSTDLALRKGRRLTWVREALSPLSGAMDREEYDTLTRAIAATCGIEVYVWLTDIAGLDPDGAAHTIGWVADTILTGALSGTGAGPQAGTTPVAARRPRPGHRG